MATMAELRTNWAGNQVYHAAAVYRPASVAEVREIVVRSSRVKVIGSRHSFNDIADTDGAHVSLEAMSRVVALDRAACTVTVEGGMRYGELGRFLHREGFALHNLASLPHISVAGAVATATHGSGDQLGNLATAVRGLELVTASGDLIALSDRTHPKEFAGAVLGLGALGVVTKLKLAFEPPYDVEQCVFENLPLTIVSENFDAIMAGATSVSLFTEWKREAFHQVWVKQRVDAAGASPGVQRRDFFGALPAHDHRHPLPGLDAENCTRQLGLSGAWDERLPHFRLEYTPSSGAELQSEYFVSRTHAVAALRALFEMRAAIAQCIQVSEVRTIAADGLWLSPCYRRASVGIHFTWQPDWPAVRELLPRIEETLAPFEARPHWGKLFTLSAEQLRTLYAKFDDFRRLRARLDPMGKFGNEYLQRFL
jgi:alditol oxidase